MHYRTVYRAFGETADARAGTLNAFGPRALMKRLEEEGLLEETGERVDGADPGPGDVVKPFIHDGKPHLVTRNQAYGYLQVERAVPPSAS
jgi:hypothetical protein